MINNVKLLAPNIENTCSTFNKQGYVTPILDNITVQIAQLALSMEVTSLQVKDTNLEF
jgi:hypothetical protein